MRRILVVASALGMLAAGIAGAQEIAIQALQDDVAVVSGGGGNVTAIKTADGVLVIDAFTTPQAAAAARALIEKQFPGLPIRYLVNTHYHGDHTMGNMVYRDVLIIATRNAVERMLSTYRQRAADLAGAPQKIAELQKQLDALASADAAKKAELQKELERWKGIRAQYGEFVLLPAQFQLDTGATLHFGGKTFTFMQFGKGHTDGDLVVLVPEDRLLVTGDLVFHHSLPYIDGPGVSDLQNWAATLARLTGMAAQFDTVVPGHGAVGGPDALRDMRTYLVDLWTAVSQAKAAGKTLEQAKSEITLPQYKDYLRYAALPGNVESCWRLMQQP